jgi:hypothetical protein
MKNDELTHTDDPLRPDEQDLTPPHGDELRDEITFGRTDRYANIDDQNATRQRTLEEGVEGQGDVIDE